RLKPVTAGGIAMAAYEAIKAYYARQRIRATAHVALCEEAAIGAVAALNELGVSVPEEVSLVDYAGTSRAQLCIPSLTAIDVNVDQHLDAALKQIESIFDDPHRPSTSGYLTVIPPSLIERGSTAKRN
ncbi:MAG: substrate-binding domain-containing protein, partial [Planctomycetota bacterium]